MIKLAKYTPLDTKSLFLGASRQYTTCANLCDLATDVFYKNTEMHYNLKGKHDCYFDSNTSVKVGLECLSDIASNDNKIINYETDKVRLKIGNLSDTIKALEEDAIKYAEKTSSSVHIERLYLQPEGKEKTTPYFEISSRAIQIEALVLDVKAPFQQVASVRIFSRDFPTDDELRDSFAFIKGLLSEDYLVIKVNDEFKKRYNKTVGSFFGRKNRISLSNKLPGIPKKGSLRKIAKQLPEYLRQASAFEDIIKKHERSIIDYELLIEKDKADITVYEKQKEDIMKEFNDARVNAMEVVSTGLSDEVAECNTILDDLNESYKNACLKLSQKKTDLIYMESALESMYNDLEAGTESLLTLQGSIEKLKSAIISEKGL
ncbi:hypothetical protein COV93_06505 [Candidatus Woesearchaeota archaeon CG11_big_fil_rev_8_21_14_0_20_43_8]|nr:MAG: hypothetical protein COV93_06505 [Candidatus Woesearchaeota archaeon CG11_big_fil_rev_8_21_14_0_20_43_8]